MELAQSGYPNPQDFKTKEELILRYTQKVGETDAVKKIIEYVESQKSVEDSLVKKVELAESYTI